MQIDFHYGTSYVVARLAGYSKEEAHTIATSAQYIDDAIHDGPLRFDNEALFSFESSAHRMIDYRNFQDLKNHLSWIPFHFLPGNEYDPESEIPEFIQRIVCKPNSEIAQEMLAKTLEQKDNLHLIGVTAHTYVDTWAHQNFAGISHEVNEIVSIHHCNGAVNDDMEKKRRRYFFAQNCGRKTFGLFKRIGLGKAIERLKIGFINDLSPLGHGPALGYPDLPYLKWRYQPKVGSVIERDNTEIFMDATKHLFEFFCKARGVSISMEDSDLRSIRELLEFENPDEKVRLQKWYEAVETGCFSFGSEYCKYDENEWIYAALGVMNADEIHESEFVYKDGFLDSDWKRVHDAIRIHRNHVVHEILPKFKLCVA